MIEKIVNFEKIIEKKGGGKTLDLSGGKRKRTYTMRRNLDDAGKASPSGHSKPKTIIEYG